MKRQDILFFSLMLLTYSQFIFSNPGDQEQAAKINRQVNLTVETRPQISTYVLSPSPPCSPLQRATKSDTEESSSIADPQKTLTREQIHNCLLALKTFCTETGTKEEGSKVATTLSAFSPKK